MIARIAQRAICSPKLAETFLMPVTSALERRSRSFVSCVCSVRSSDSVLDLERRVAVLAAALADTLHLRVPWPMPRRLAHVLDRRRLRRRQRHLRAALEVDAEVETLDEIAPIETPSITPEMANQTLRLPMMSIWIHFAAARPRRP